MKGIFISYRRDDTASEARLLYNYLRREFGDGRVFMDVEALREPGADFVDAIHSSLSSCDAVLVVIGRQWAGTDAKTGRSRLDSEGDFIRMEVSMALQRGVRVIPVLVAGASMPAAEVLPEDLRTLSRRQAVSLSHEDWDYSIGKLVDGLAKVLGYKRNSGAAVVAARRRWPLLAGGAVLGVAVMVALGLMYGDGDPSVRVEVPTTPLQASPPQMPAARTPETNASAPAKEIIEAPVARPVPALMPSPPASDPALVAQAQRLLSELGYQPGPADGVPGSATAAAIAAFQDDYGVGGVRGAVGDGLVRSLQAAVAERQVAAGAGISGVWYTDEGVAFDVQQNGAHVAFHLNGVLVGEGGVNGNAMELLYDMGGGVSGYIVASIDGDGRHIRGTDTMINGYVQPIVLHYEHMAQ